MENFRWLTHTADPDLEKATHEKIQVIKAVEDDIPGVIIVHNLPADSIVYISAEGCRNLKVSLEDVRLPHFDYHKRFFNPEDVPNYAPKILGMLQRNIINEMVTYFQQVRASPTEDWKWYSSSSKILLQDKEGQPLLGITVAIPIDTAHFISPKIERLVEENNFLRKNQGAFALLSKREKEVLRHLALGNDTQEIADQLFISDATVKTHRKNIRAKLQAESTVDLVKFAQAFNLI